MIHTHQTAPPQFVEAAGIRFGYRRFGVAIDIPLLFFMHFTGTMDHWDPALTDGFQSKDSPSRPHSKPLRLGYALTWSPQVQSKPGC
jgi:hypothetical protein